MKIEGEAGRSRPRIFNVLGRLLYGSPRKEKRIWSWRGKRRFWAGRFFASIDFFSGAQLPFRVAGGAEGVEEAGGEVDFTGEKSARGFLATAVEIGHGKVLLELVMHRFEIFC